MGPFIVASSTRASFCRTPRLPGRYHREGLRLARWPAGRKPSGKRGQAMEEVTDEPLYRDRVCGIDIGKAQMYATIRVPSGKNPARRASETRGFATTRRGVLALADWLRAWQVPAVVMEATGDHVQPELVRGGRAGPAVRPQQADRRQGRAPLACVPPPVSRPDAARAARGRHRQHLPAQAARHGHPADPADALTWSMACSRRAGRRPVPRRATPDTVAQP